MYKQTKQLTLLIFVYTHSATVLNINKTYIFFNLFLIWTQNCIVLKASVDVNLLLMIQFYIPWEGEREGGYDENLK
jgi:hypothetical protein